LVFLYSSSAIGNGNTGILARKNEFFNNIKKVRNLNRQKVCADGTSMPSA
jgi:hypothetical protein